MPKSPATVEEYLQGLSDDRRVAVEAIRAVVLKNLPQGYEEGIQYGMIGYFVPHSLYPNGYHCDPKQPLPFLQIGSQKNHIGLYLFCIYCDPEIQAWFCEEWKKTGLKLDMGKSCVRVKKLDNIPLPLIGKVVKKISVKKFIRSYEAGLAQSPKQSSRSKPAKASVKAPATSKDSATKAAKSKLARKKKTSPTSSGKASKKVAARASSVVAKTSSRAGGGTTPKRKPTTVKRTATKKSRKPATAKSRS